LAGFLCPETRVGPSETYSLTALARRSYLVTYCSSASRASWLSVLPSRSARSDASAYRSGVIRKLSRGDLPVPPASERRPTRRPLLRSYPASASRASSSASSSVIGVRLFFVVPGTRLRLVGILFFQVGDVLVAHRHGVDHQQAAVGFDGHHFERRAVWVG